MLEHIASDASIIGPPSLDQAVGETVALEQRLNRGWELIDRAEAQGKCTDAMFEHFLDLLGKYELLLDGGTRS